MIRALKTLDSGYHVQQSEAPPTQFARFATTIEQNELPGTADDGVIAFASSLYHIASRYRFSDPRQCLAVLGMGFEEVRSRAQAGSPNDFAATLANRDQPESRCRAWLRLFEFALSSDVHSGSDFLRTLRSSDLPTRRDSL